MKNSLLVSDLHFTSAVRDAYRFKLFDQILAETKKRPVDAVWILGDLTDSKDNHNAVLVNTIVNHIASLAERAHVHILRGNHDGLDFTQPYFAFLNHIPRVHFHAGPTVLPGKVLLLPHSRTPADDWKPFKFEDYDFILMHATVEGAVAENDQALASAVRVEWFKKTKARIFAGDVHVPQTVAGKIVYVGAPYAVRYGDSFRPRMLYLDHKENAFELPLENTRRYLVDVKEPHDLDPLDCRPGDQIKVRVHLKEADLGKWSRIRQQVILKLVEKKLDVAAVELVVERSQRSVMRARAVAGLTAAEVLAKYVERQRVPDDIADIGTELLHAHGVVTDPRHGGDRD